MCRLTMLNSACISSAGSPLYDLPSSSSESGNFANEILAMRRRISAGTGGIGGGGGGGGGRSTLINIETVLKSPFGSSIVISAIYRLWPKLGLVLSEEISCCSSIWRSWTCLAGVFIMAIERVEKSKVPHIPKRATKSYIPALNVYLGAGEISVSPALVVALSVIWRVSMLLMAAEKKQLMFERLPALCLFQSPHAISEVNLSAGNSSELTGFTPQRPLAALAGVERCRKKMIPALGFVPMVKSAPVT
jgi:hypothetical protein